MDKEDVVHIYNGILLSQKKKTRATLNNNINHRYLPSNIMNVTNILFGKIANYKNTV